MPVVIYEVLVDGFFCLIANRDVCPLLVSGCAAPHHLHHVAVFDAVSFAR